MSLALTPLGVSLVPHPLRRAQPSAEEGVALIHSAGRPFFDVLFGSPGAARRRLGAWLQRPTSEVYVGRLRGFGDGTGFLGGYVALGGAELARCRMADALALVGDARDDEREVLRARLKASAGLWPRVPADALYLSKIGLTEPARGRGLGRVLVRAVVQEARHAGASRVALDVSTDNAPARRIYEHAGFSEVRRAEAEVDGTRLEYVHMELPLD